MRLKRMSGALCMLVAAVLFSGAWVATHPANDHW
jgi:hypothetical protein